MVFQLSTVWIEFKALENGESNLGSFRGGLFMSKWIFGVVLFLVAAVSRAQTKKSDPRLQYVGAITINSANPKALTRWYTQKLGLHAISQYHAPYYSSPSTHTHLISPATH